MTKTLAAIAAAAGLYAGAAHALPAPTFTIDFESFSEGDPFDGLVTVPGGLSFVVTTNRNDSSTNPSIICSTLAGSECTDNDPDLEAPLTGVGLSAGDPDLNPGNVLIIQNDNGEIDDDASGGSITLSDFSLPVRLISAIFIDTSDDPASPGAEMFVDGVQIGVGGQTQFGGGDNSYESVAFGLIPVLNEIKVILPGSGAIGGLEFAGPPGSTEVIPLPAAAWMLIAGVGGLAGLRARRKAEA